MPKQRVTSRSAAQEAQMLLDAARGLPEKPDHVELREGDMPFWEMVVSIRPRSDWSEAQLTVAAQLARCMNDVEQLQRDVDKDGFVVLDRFNQEKVNPALSALDSATRRQLALMRSLGLSFDSSSSDPASRQAAYARAKNVQKRAKTTPLLAGVE